MEWMEYRQLSIPEGSFKGWLANTGVILMLGSIFFVVILGATGLIILMTNRLGITDDVWWGNKLLWGWVSVIWTLIVAGVGGYFSQHSDNYHISAVREHNRLLQVQSNCAEEIRRRQRLVNRLEDRLIRIGYPDAAELINSSGPFGALKSRTSIATFWLQENDEEDE